MSRYATATDYFGGAMYDAYGHFPIHTERADWIIAKWPGVVGQKVLIAGCGPGAYLVEELVNRGVNCFGIDGFQKNANHGFVTITPPPAIAARCILDADMSNNSDAARIKGNQYAKITGQQKFYLIVTEDVLSCLTTQEITVGVGIAQSNADRVLHILMCNRSADGPDPERDTTMGLNWWTEAAWRTLINSAGGSTHVCLNTETRTEF
jgi:hypothetical protein